MKSPAELQVRIRCFCIIIFFFIVSAQPSPILNQILSEKSNDPDKIIYPSEIIDEKQTKPITTQRERTDEFKRKQKQGICAESAISNGSRLAADVDQENVACYEVGTQGPCPSNMKFYTIPDENENGIGMCDCDQELHGIGYSNETNGCHHLFRQEYCTEGHWLEWTQEGLKCTPNLCIQKGTPQPVGIVMYNAQCVNLYEPCNNTLEGYVGHFAFDSSNKIRCLPDETNYSLSQSIPPLKCSEGTRWSTISTSCRKAVKFTFS